MPPERLPRRDGGKLDLRVVLEVHADDVHRGRVVPEELARRLDELVLVIDIVEEHVEPQDIVQRGVKAVERRLEPPQGLPRLPLLVTVQLLRQRARARVRETRRARREH